MVRSWYLTSFSSTDKETHGNGGGWNVSWEGNWFIYFNICSTELFCSSSEGTIRVQQVQQIINHNSTFTVRSSQF